MAVSPLTYEEVSQTADAQKRQHLGSWFVEIWEYWREILRNTENLPSFIEADDARVHYLLSGILDVLPDVADRVLICDAIAYQCDAFCTRDWGSLLKHREALEAIPLRILAPHEWWDMLRAWSALWC